MPLEYHLSLANGQRWNISGDREISPWLNKLASIMELKADKSNGHPKLIFRRNKSMKKLSDDYQVQNLGLIKIHFSHNSPNLICEIGNETDATSKFTTMWLSLYPIYKRALLNGGISLHSALIEKNGYCLLLAGPGNIGKSTCCQRIPKDWQVWCDDETLVVRDNNSGYFAHPFPTWSDYMWRASKKTFNVQRYVPVNAIFFLEQAQENKAIPLGNGKASVLITQSCMQILEKSWRKLEHKEVIYLRTKLFKNACALTKKVPCFTLKVSLKGRFWEEIERALADV